MGKGGPGGRCWWGLLPGPPPQLSSSPSPVQKQNTVCFPVLGQGIWSEANERALDLGNDVLGDPNMDSRRNFIQIVTERPFPQRSPNPSLTVVDASPVSPVTMDLEAAPEPKPQGPDSWSPSKSTAQPSWMFKYKGSPVCHRKDILRMFSFPGSVWLGLRHYRGRSFDSLARETGFLSGMVRCFLLEK